MNQVRVKPKLLCLRCRKRAAASNPNWYCKACMAEHLFEVARADVQPRNVFEAKR